LASGNKPTGTGTGKSHKRQRQGQRCGMADGY
jgi:hypothetical protein